MLILEVKINNPKKDKYMPSNYKVEVYPNDHYPPHIHYTNTDGLDIKVDIVTLEVIDSAPRKNIKTADLKSWKWLNNEKSILINWLDKESNKMEGITNYQAIIYCWNLYHPTMSISE